MNTDPKPCSPHTLSPSGHRPWLLLFFVFSPEQPCHFLTMETMLVKQTSGVVSHTACRDVQKCSCLCLLSPDHAVQRRSDGSGYCKLPYLNVERAKNVSNYVFMFFKGLFSYSGSRKQRSGYGSKSITCDIFVTHIAKMRLVVELFYAYNVGTAPVQKAVI
jgi:hypothetical protein